MAANISFIDNLPVKFNNTDDSCVSYDNRPFCQLAQWSDDLMVIFKPKRLDITVANPGFTGGLTSWTAGTGWTGASNKAHHASGNTGSLSQVLPVNFSTYYKITFTISSIVGSGTLSIGIGNGGVDIVDPIAGTYSVYINTENSSAALSFRADDLTLDLDNIVVEEVSHMYSVTAFDITNNAYGTVESITEYYREFAIFKGKWSDFGFVNPGCYQIAIKEAGNTTSGAELVTNGNFATNLSGWTVVTGALETWVQSGGKAVLRSSNDATAGTAKLKQTLAGMTIGNFYRLTFTIDANMALLFASNANNTITAKLFNSPTTSFLPSAGTYTLDVLYTGSSNDIVFKLLTGDIDGNSMIDADDASILDTFSGGLDNVSVKLLSATSTNSECYNLKTTQPCTKLLKWTNSKNGFGIPYASITNKYHYLRLECDIRNSKYPTEKNRFVDSGGNNKLYYANVRKAKDLLINEVPEYIHDAIGIGMAHTDLFIDDVQYNSLDSDYQPEWDRKQPLKFAKSQILIERYSQDEKNID